MKIEIQKFLATITDDKFQKQSLKTTKGKLNCGFKAAVKSSLDFMIKNIKANQIAQAELTTQRPETSIRLETCVINLPLRYAKNISKVTKDQGTYDVNVYMVIESPEVNHSKLRIDELCAAADLVQQPEIYLPKFKAWVDQQFAQIDANKSAAKSKTATTKSKKAEK